MLQLQSWCATATDAREPWSPCSATREAATVRSTHTVTRENTHTATKTQYSQKKQGGGGMHRELLLLLLTRIFTKMLFQMVHVYEVTSVVYNSLRPYGQG